jgi:hypothetical protein
MTANRTEKNIARIYSGAYTGDRVAYGVGMQSLD